MKKSENPKDKNKEIQEIPTTHMRTRSRDKQTADNTKQSAIISKTQKNSKRKSSIDNSKKRKPSVDGNKKRNSSVADENKKRKSSIDDSKNRKSSVDNTNKTTRRKKKFEPDYEELATNNQSREDKHYKDYIKKLNEMRNSDKANKEGPTHDEIKQSDFPEPKFEGEGQLGVNGYRYYKKATIDGNSYQIGDSVLILTDEVDDTYIGKIVDMYVDRENNSIVKVLWYSRRYEFEKEAQRYIMQRELVLTEWSDEIPLDSIKSKCIIYDSPEPLGDDANKKHDSLTNTFFCNRGFIRQRQEFVALSTLNRLIKQTAMVVETVSGETKFDMARARLQLNFVTNVAGRQKEIDYVEKTLTGFLKRGGLGGCIYLSGVPGTGKTLVVREVMRRLASKELEGELPEFQFYEINCLRFESPREIYSELWKMLNYETVNPTTAQRALNDIFTTETSPFYIVVLVDEIDVLLTPQQNELYCLLEWSSLPNAKFIVIAVANLMDLESRLKPKIASRMGRSSIKFFAYKYEQLYEIIESRISDLDAFADSAIVLCARSISGNGGDARKALETCKRAIDLRKNRNDIVQAKDMSNALKQVQSIQAKEIINQITYFHKIFLTALLQAIKIGQKSSVPLREIIDRSLKISRQLNFPTIPNYQFNLIANQLITMNIVKGNKDGPVNASSSISLQTFDQELIFHLEKSEELKQFLPKLEVNYV